MVQVGSQLRTQGQTLADYSRWPYLVSCWYGYELLQGTMRWKDPNFEFNLRTSATVLESPYKLENNRLTILGETYERVQNGFLLNWDKDGHPQVP